MLTGLFKLYVDPSELILSFSIFEYATASTEESVYIIGGSTGVGHTSGRSSSSIIAKYSDGIWTNVGRLKQGRHGHAAITSQGKTMIVGGQTYDKRGEWYIEGK